MKFDTYTAVVESACGTLTRHEAPGPIRAQVECLKKARAHGCDVTTWQSVLVFRNSGGEVRTPHLDKRWDNENVTW